MNFPICIWFWNETFDSKIMCRLSWKTWKIGNTILFHWVCNELMSFKPRSLTIQWSRSTELIFVEKFREFEIFSRNAIVDNLHFHVLVSMTFFFIISAIYVGSNLLLASKKIKQCIFLDVIINKTQQQDYIFPKSHCHSCINPI